ncbi:MAG TPA: hypothetical protein VK737_00600 [Opitutales bacterium]|jgi:hypothetical protein|nr:hypothetical protein [Opitutales bacterium]
MTFDEAKTILNLCPPEDETNPDVPGLSGALILANANRQLGAWWEHEKKIGAQFSRKLNSIVPPAELTTTILRGGATIFFASRLIAESTGETLPEPAPLTVESSREKTAAEKLVAAFEVENKTPSVGKSWIWTWRIALLLVVIVAFLLGLLSLILIWH